jgi:hypothetical protein
VENPNYIKEKRTVSLARANRLGCLLYFPVVLVYGLPFHLLTEHISSISDYMDMLKTAVQPAPFILVVLAVLFGGIILHELIHGITWALFARRGWRSIRFGVLWKYMTPYCHCRDPLTISQYIWGAIMPFVILGLIPGVASWFTGSVALLAFGIFFTVSAVGDFMIIGLIRKEPHGSLVLDHPSEAGYYIYNPKDAHARN